MKRVSSLMIGAVAALGLMACDAESPAAPDASTLAPPPVASTYAAFAPEGSELIGTVRICEDWDGAPGLERCDDGGQIYRNGTVFHYMRDNLGPTLADPPDGVPEITSGAAPGFGEILTVDAVFSHRGRPHVVFTGRRWNGAVATQLGRTNESGRNWSVPVPVDDLGAVESCEDWDGVTGLERCDENAHIYRDGTTFYLVRDNLGESWGDPPDGVLEVSVGTAPGFAAVLQVFAVFSFEGRPNVIFLGARWDGSIVTRVGTTNVRGRDWAALVPVYNDLPAVGEGCASYNGLPGLERCDGGAVIDVSESPAGIELTLTGDFEGASPEIPGPDGVDEVISSLLPSNFSDFQLVAVGFLYGKPYILFDVFDADIGDRRVRIVTTSEDGRSWAASVDAGELS